uniref:Uncharacterized protein n=1 Tax=Romanomermis culicivorax TaxID=13658 RepID=A0A915J2Z0_ROMCU
MSLNGSIFWVDDSMAMAVNDMYTVEQRCLYNSNGRRSQNIITAVQSYLFILRAVCPGHDTAGAMYL